MVRALEGGEKKKGKNLGATRSLFGGGNTRSLKRKKVSVLRLDKASGKQAEASYETGDELGSINLKIEFDFNSADIRPTSRALLDALGTALKDPRLEGRSITIAGHTDSTGDSDFNRRLSLLRAQAVSDYLARYFAIDTTRFEIIGFGEAMPLVANDTAGQRQANRRVEIISR